MFERYNEKARRIIFFARYEAIQCGSTFIETEHLLLGWLREEPHNSKLVSEENRVLLKNRAECLWPTPRRALPSSDLPLSNECKRVLAYTAEEAHRLRHGHIGSEHLILGLLRERRSAAAQILEQSGIDIENARAVARQFPTVDTSTTVVIHGSAWDASYVGNMAEDLRRYCWVKREWKIRDLLVEKNTGKIMFCGGGPFDAERFEVRKGGWRLDHCAICRWELKEDSDTEHGVGYTNGHEWICSECHDRLIAGKGKEPLQT